MKLLLAAALLLLASCGKDDSGASSADNKGTEIKNEKKDDRSGVTTSYYVDSADDLVACDVERRGTLAYVKKGDEFKACLASGWETVNVRGKDGKDGKDGAVPLDPTFWTDPFTGKLWHIGGNTKVVNLQCAAGYSVPTDAQANEADLNGLGAAILRVMGSAEGYWRVYAGSGYSYYVKGVSAGTWSQASYGALRVCIKD